MSKKVFSCGAITCDDVPFAKLAEMHEIDSKEKFIGDLNLFTFSEVKDVISYQDFLCFDLELKLYCKSSVLPSLYQAIFFNKPLHS